MTAGREGRSRKGMGGSDRLRFYLRKGMELGGEWNGMGWGENDVAAVASAVERSDRS